MFFYFLDFCVASILILYEKVTVTIRDMEKMAVFSSFYLINHRSKGMILDEEKGTPQKVPSSI